MPLSKFDQAASLWHRVRWPSHTILVGDQEREKVTDFLALAMSEGYITREEHDKRVDLALTAKYEHELDWAKDELPFHITPRPKPLEQAIQENLAKRAGQQHMSRAALAAMIIAVICVVAAYMAVLVTAPH
jgi:hypothetical protein